VRVTVHDGGGGPVRPQRPAPPDVDVDFGGPCEAFADRSRWFSRRSEGRTLRGRDVLGERSHELLPRAAPIFEANVHQARSSNAVAADSAEMPRSVGNTTARPPRSSMSSTNDSSFDHGGRRTHRERAKRDARQPFVENTSFVPIKLAASNPRRTGSRGSILQNISVARRDAGHTPRAGRHGYW